MIVSARYGVLEEIIKQERSHGSSASAAEEPQTQSRSSGMPRQLLSSLTQARACLCFNVKLSLSILQGALDVRHCAHSHLP